MLEVDTCLGLMLLLAPLAVQGAGAVLHTPVWFMRLMAEKNCTFTHMMYSDKQCDLKLFFNGEFPSYMQVVGLGLDDDLQPDTAEFGAAICRCGVMEYAGICSDQLLGVLAGLRGACGVDNLRFLPPLGLTQQQWMERKSPKVYQTVRIPVSAIDTKAEAEIVSKSLMIIQETSEAEITTQQSSDEEEYILQQELTTQKQELTSREHELTTQQQELTSREQELTTQQQELTSREQELTTQQQELTSREQELTTQQQELTSREQELTTQQQELTSREQEFITQEQELSSGDQEFITQEEKLTTVQTTTQQNLTTQQEFRTGQELATQQQEWTTVPTTTQQELATQQQELTTVHTTTQQELTTQQEMTTQQESSTEKDGAVQNETVIDDYAEYYYDYESSAGLYF